jgi:DNA-binding transcriptional LysR family regulator
MQHIENLMGEMQDHARGVKGHVRIYANTNSIEFLPGVLASYLASHPFVSIDLREQLSRDVVQAVTEGSTDIGIVAGNIYTGTLQVLPYKHDRLVLTTAINHPLAERGTIPFSESLSWDYVGLLEGSAMHVYISAAAKELNIPLKVRIQVGNFEALCRMVEENVGVGIVPESVARRHEKNMRIRIVDLSDDWAVRNLKVCVRDLQMLPSFARELVDLLVADADAEIEVGLAISK